MEEELLLVKQAFQATVIMNSELMQDKRKLEEKLQQRLTYHKAKTEFPLTEKQENLKKTLQATE